MCQENLKNLKNFQLIEVVLVTAKFIQVDNCGYVRENRKHTLKYLGVNSHFVYNLLKGFR